MTDVGGEVFWMKFPEGSLCVAARIRENLAIFECDLELKNQEV